MNTVPGLDFYRAIVRELARMPGARVFELGHPTSRSTLDFRDTESNLYYGHLVHLPFPGHGWIVSLGQSREPTDIIQADVTCILAPDTIPANTPILPYFVAGLTTVPYNLSTISALYADGVVAGNTASGPHMALLWEGFHHGIRDAVMSSGYAEEKFEGFYPAYPPDCGPAAARHLHWLLSRLSKYSPAGATPRWPRHDRDY
jgi:hypothetical protein